MKHTQGDWFVMQLNAGQDPDEIMSRVNGCLVSVATVAPACEYTQDSEEGESTHTVTQQEAAANAQLLANTARMYQALKRIAHGVEDGASLSGTDCAEIAEEILAEVRAA